MTKEMLVSILSWISNIPSEVFLHLVYLLLYLSPNVLQAGLGGLSFDEGQFSVFG
jgi:hypothetical protein